MASKEKLKHDGTIAIAVGQSRKELNWKNQEMQWSDFVKKLSSPVRTKESYEEYRAFPKTKRDEIKDVGGYVGGSLKGGRRKADAVAWRSLLTLDIDNVPQGYDLWPTVSEVMCYAAVLYSTHSHTEDKQRLRLVLPLSRRVNSDEYAAVSRRIAADIGIDMCDDTTYEQHRLMYWPSASYDAPYRFEVSDDNWIDVDEILSRYSDWRDPAEWPQSSRKTSTIKRMAQRQGEPTEKAGLIGAFCRAYSIEDAIEAFLLEVYSKCSNGRYTYCEGSTAGGLIIYEDGKFAYSHHGTDPTGGKLCNAFDLVRIHKFGVLDEDVPSDTAVTKLPSYKAMREFARTDPETCGHADGFDDGDEAEVEWKKKLTLTSAGKIENAVANVVTILENDTKVADKFMFDEFKERAVITDDLPWIRLAKRTSADWVDADDSGLRMYLEKRYGIDNITKIKDGLEVVMSRHRVHPVKDYLTGLVWDEQPRIEKLLVDHLGAEDCEYTRAVTRKALIGAVARIMKAGCKHDHMLVLIGPQGCGKSTTLARLGREWFSDSMYTVAGKDAYEQLQGHWIIEMGEMAATRKAELEQIKQFVSKQTDSYRAAYARRTQEHPRQCAFFGTTNDIEFLKDLSGGRRFWPVVVEGTGENLFESLNDEFVDQVWAEALTYFKRGEKWHLSRKMENEAKIRQEQHTEQSSKKGMIENYLDILLPKNWYELSIGDRQMFIQGEGFDEEGTEPRTAISAIEIWCECFRGDPKMFNLVQAREINMIMRKFENWKESGRINCGKAFGRQRGFVRSVTMTQIKSKR